MNQRSRVLALAPGFDGLATLELQGPGDDPREAAEAFAEKEDLTFAQANTLRIGDLPAFRARTRLRLPEGPVVAELTWITHDGNIYRLMGGAPSEKFRRYEGVFRSFARSFRPLLEEERSQIYDLRLRIAVAQEGEDLAALTRRTENEWDLNWTAVVNDLFVEQPLSEGQLVKIAVKEPYHPAPTVEEPPVYGPSLPGRVP